MRDANGRLALRPFYREVVAGRRVLLADDVRNTGETFARAKAAVESAGGKVIGTVEICDRLEATVECGVPNFALAEYPAPASIFGRPKWSRALVARWLGGEPSMPDGDYSLLTLAEVAQLLSVSRATAYRLRKKPDLQHLEMRVRQEARYPLCRVRTLVLPD